MPKPVALVGLSAREKKQQPTIADCRKSIFVLRKFLLRADSTNRHPIAAIVVVVHTVVTVVEIKTPRVERRGDCEFARPIDARMNDVAIVYDVAIGQKNGVAVGPCAHVPEYPILGRRNARTIVVQFAYFIVGWHSPACAPVGSGCIPARRKRGRIA